ncbi:hypothetical protein PIROE2DRAFT_3969, partial [Piromyces sp. E2]
MSWINDCFSQSRIIRNIQELSQYIMKNSVDFINTTPTRFELFMENELFRKAMKHIKTIFLLGEKLSYALCEEIHKYSNSNIYDGYGPTECTVICSYKHITNNNTSIGKPITNVCVYILDNELKPVPIGVEGEIYIGGAGVGQGYINRKELTKEKFVKSPFIKDTLFSNNIYSTGDIGKWNEEGEIIYIGRNDFQVKINGQRIELSEIENTIKLYPDIEYVVVVHTKDTIKNSQYLICYYKTKESGNGTSIEDEIKKFASSKLPSYMVPNFYYKLEELPLLPSGKLNRKALPEIDISEISKKNYVSPETETEKLVCGIVEKLFNLQENEVGKKTNLFEIGLNSISAIKIISHIKNHYNIKIGIKDVNNHPIIEEFSEYIDYLISGSQNVNDLNIIKKIKNKYFPITSQQLGIYIDFKKIPDVTTYNIPISLKLQNNINIEKLEKSIQKVFNNNSILKTKYLDCNELSNIDKFNLSGKEIERFENEINEQNNNEKIFGVIDENAKLEIEYLSSDKINSFIRPFNLEEAPLMRVAIVDKSLLLLDIHHIISDGNSLSLLIQQINECYHDTEKELTGDEVQYSDYAYFINEKKGTQEYDEQFKFYEEMFSAVEYETPEIPLKTINNTESQNTLHSEQEEEGKVTTYQKFVDKTLNDSINNFVKKNNLSITSFFFSIYVYVLSKYSNQSNVYTSIISNNRNSVQCEEMIGMFVKTQPLLINIASDVSFKNFITDNMNILLKVYDDEYVSFVGLTDKLKFKTINNCFVYQPEDIFSSNNENSIFKTNEDNTIYSIIEDTTNSSSTSSKFDISFNIIEKQSNYLISVNYNGNIYDPNTIERFVQSIEEVIYQIEKYDNVINDIEYIPMNEKNRIIYEFNSDNYEYENAKCYHTEFENVAKEKPNDIAVIYNDIKINYRKLDEMSNSLGHLLRMKNVERNDIIPIITDRSPSFIVSTLAISKAGGAFLPIDKNLPDDRISYILSEVSPKLVLCNCDLSEIDIKIREQYTLYDVNKHDYNENITKLDNINEVQDTCYVLFTSGTTGKPKGTILTHYNLYNY